MATMNQKEMTSLTNVNVWLSIFVSNVFLGVLFREMVSYLSIEEGFNLRYALGSLKDDSSKEDSVEEEIASLKSFGS